MGLNNCKDSANGDQVEGIVCQESDIPENGMKVCDLGDGGKVLVIKQNGQISAIGSKCSHYGAPLASGALGNGRVRCPWHGACFNIKNGDIEDFPGLDSIPCYKVEIVHGGGVKVKGNKSVLAANKRMKEMTKRDPKNDTTFVVVGAGGAGLCCAESLRQEGFSGRLVVLSAEPYYPYDRVKLSKMLNATPEQLKLRPEGFFKEHDIELLLTTKANSLNTSTKKVALSSGESIDYDSIFIATGSVPRRIDLPGSDLGNIFTLRSLQDAEKIHAAITPESKVLVYGSSFIGMEAAAYCVGKCASVTVVGRSSVPFAESLGETIGSRIARIFTEKGVNLKMGLTISSFSPKEGEAKVGSVTLSDDSSLEADVVLMGLGSTFATDFLKESGVDLNANGSVPTNQFLETNVAGVFAGGDVAHAPVLANNYEPTTIGHWQLAHYHGKVAAHNMLGKSKPLETVPFFWTMLFGTSFRYAGYGAGYDDTLVVGDVEALKCAIYYCKGGKIIAVTTVGFDPVAAHFAELLSSGRTLTKQQLQQNPTDWWKPEL